MSGRYGGKLPVKQAYLLAWGNLEQQFKAERYGHCSPYTVSLADTILAYTNRQLGNEPALRKRDCRTSEVRQRSNNTNLRHTNH